MIPRPVEVSLYKFCEGRKNKSFLLAVSGGLDSMALLYAFHEIAKRLKFSFGVAHIHHGPGSEVQVQYRSEAKALVQRVCARLEIPFYSNLENEIQIELRSEQQFRHLRLSELSKIKKQNHFDYVVFAHHCDDLFETRVLRLIRGTGPQGLRAMRAENGVILRPFLHLSKEELAAYLKMVQGEFVADPSNKKSRYLRNWIRHEWLPALERRQPGACRSMARTLELLSEALESPLEMSAFFDDGKLSRSVFLHLGVPDKRRVLAYYLQSKNIKDFGLSHINELLKRLDVEQKDLTFSLLKKKWLANARHIWCES